MKKLVKVALLLALLCTMLCAGCVRPKKVQKWQDINPNQTAFVIQLEGKMTDQVKVSSPEDWNKRIVAATRIPINQRWHSTSRMMNVGEYIETTKIITVDRSDVAREWQTSEGKGTSKNDEGIWAESKDSIEFSVPVACVANIKIEDAGTFLFYYKGDSLAIVMDSVIRSHIMTKMTDFSGKTAMTGLRAQKPELKKYIASEIIPFFKTRGITITNVGLSGGFTYKDKEIQIAINSVFIADQTIAAADKKQLAQDKINLKIIKEAQAFKDAAILKAEGKAAGIRLVNSAAEEANANPVFIELKTLEVEVARIDKWNGQYPLHYWSTGGNGNADMGIIVNAPVAKR